MIIDLLSFVYCGTYVLAMCLMYVILWVFIKLIILFIYYTFRVEPKIPDLLKIVVPKVAVHWETVAYFLEFEVPRVEIIGEKFSSNPEKCCRQVLIHWLNSKEGISPKTWEVLLRILKDITDIAAVTEDIEKELQQR